MMPISFATRDCAFHTLTGDSDGRKCRCKDVCYEDGIVVESHRFPLQSARPDAQNDSDSCEDQKTAAKTIILMPPSDEASAG